MDTQSILNLPKEHRRTFVWLMIAILVISALLDGFAGSASIRDLLLAHVRNIASAILVSLFVLWVVSSLIPQSTRNWLLEIEPKRITGEFDALLATADRWRYKGNFGRYMRAKVLPTLAGRNNMHVSVCIIDPENEQLCTRHAEYRSQINAIDKGVKYDSDRVALEVIVTIVLCAWYVINRRVTIDVFLTPVFDPVRIDSSDDAMILTVEDRRSPALKVTREHFSYEHFNLQMEFSRTQARAIRLGGVRTGIQLAELTSGDVEAALRFSGLQGLLARHSADQILQACKASRNPYES
jgi:energy-converting hydrogenase Eha subunit G